MPTKYTQQYLDNILSYDAMNAFIEAAQNYVNARIAWGEGKVPYGYRGGWSGFQFFFNRETTKKNIIAMKKVLKICKNSRTLLSAKKNRIRELKTEFSEGGRGIELVDAFLDTSFSESSAYVASGLNRSQSFIITDSQFYKKRKALGDGGFGHTDSFESDNGNRLAIKHVFNGGNSKNALEFEMKIFNRVYQNLYVGKFASTQVQSSEQVSSLSRTKSYTSLLESGRIRKIDTKFGKRDVVNSVLMPEIGGTSLKDFASKNPKEFMVHSDDIFLNIFNFLHELHFNLKMVHGDCHDDNVMIIDEFHNIFLIDYGEAERMTYYNQMNWSAMMTADLLMGLSYYIYLRQLCSGKVKKTVSRDQVEGLCKKFELKRWMGSDGICYDIALFSYYQLSFITKKLGYMQKDW
ncbi:MAG: hypothetical protein GY750_05760 [Lentisphaerae bacterium]|nr:hypothetical protein [Lentisphaerota bacterium]MCP4100915.1 hypothetical protein [Lentisphaerota bacterium]